MIEKCISKVWHLPTTLFEIISLKCKRLYYDFLSEDALEDLVKEKEQEIKDIEFVEHQQLEELKQEMRTDLEKFGYSDEEIEEMVDTAFGEDTND